MRPDPYKRARSRAYKAKHGLLPAKNGHNQTGSAELPGNISAEDITALREHAADSDEDSFDINLEELDLSTTAPETPSSETVLSYPKSLLESIFGGSTGKAIFTETASIESLLRKHGWDVPSFSVETLQALTSNDSGPGMPLEDPLVAGNRFIKVELAIQEAKRPSPSSNPIDTKPSHELEDWLDQVIDDE
jgi:hypothetical protein